MAILRDSNIAHALRRGQSLAFEVCCFRYIQSIADIALDVVLLVAYVYCLVTVVSGNIDHALVSCLATRQDTFGAVGSPI